LRFGFARLALYLRSIYNRGEGVPKNQRLVSSLSRIDVDPGHVTPSPNREVGSVIGHLRLGESSTQVASRASFERIVSAAFAGNGVPDE